MAAGPILRPIDVPPSALLALHAALPRRYPALFESAASGRPPGATRDLDRFDILFAYPGERLTLSSPRAPLESDRPAMPATAPTAATATTAPATAPAAAPAGAPAAASGATAAPILSLPRSAGEGWGGGLFLPALDQWWQRERADTPPRDIPVPFMGGWLLYLGYELAAQIEPRLRVPLPTAGPIAQAIRIPAAVIHEHDSGKTWIVAESGAPELIDQIERDVRGLQPFTSTVGPLVDGAIQEDEPERFLHAVGRALDYIAAGDIYQANLSRGWRAQLASGAQAHDLYRRLRETNPGPFSGIAVLDDIAVISSSPERLVEVRDGWVTTRPIAGTRPRGRDKAADQELARELHAHPKERAEHVMLIDLERNDLGRVCEAGSVRVQEFMTIESYAHVHHIVSSVRGRLRAGATPGSVLAAVFPGGTITGCPKVRCMEIIAELEQAARGAYTGSLGYLNLDGSMDMNILIRTATLAGRELSLRAGAGIVADSLPERELEETRAKARGVLRALSAA